MSLLSSYPAARACRCHPARFTTSFRSLSISAPRWNEKAGPKNTTETKTVQPEVKSDGIPPLNRPLGVRERPTTLVKTMTQKMKDLMDRDTRIAQRRHLVKEASKGYFHDLNMTRKHGGKTWIAPKVLIREDKALYLPNIAGISLKDDEKKNTTELCYGRISVISMLGTRISEINVQENLLKSLLVSMFLRSLRRTIPVEQHANYLVSSQNLEYLRDPMGMTNSRVGYVFLIDENLRIRWAGCADATPEEAQALESCTGVLLKRLETKPKDKLQTGAEKKG
ncbi:ATP10 protein-domain-containing protein [Cyathus striatus]|nr:ATP10 protein-domain-containing protein [Cyathus striatus]